MAHINQYYKIERKKLYDLSSEDTVLVLMRFIANVLGNFIFKICLES